MILLFSAASLSADSGPKPRIYFDFRYEISPVPIVSGQLIECQDPKCAVGRPLSNFGPVRGFRCSETMCASQAYFYRPYHQLRIEFSDKTRNSNVFEKRGFTDFFLVTVTDSALLVESAASAEHPFAERLRTGFFVDALLLTWVVEGLIAFVYLSRLGVPRKRLLFCMPLASVLTLAPIWFVFPRLPLSDALVVIVSEVFAVAFESLFVYLIGRRTLSFRRAAWLGLLMNTGSLLVGLAFLQWRDAGTWWLRPGTVW